MARVAESIFGPAYRSPRSQRWERKFGPATAVSGVQADPEISDSDDDDSAITSSHGFDDVELVEWTYFWLAFPRQDNRTVSLGRREIPKSKDKFKQWADMRGVEAQSGWYTSMRLICNGKVFWAASLESGSSDSSPSGVVVGFHTTGTEGSRMILPCIIP